MPVKRTRKVMEIGGPDLSWAILVFAVLVYAKTLLKPEPAPLADSSENAVHETEARVK